MRALSRLGGRAFYEIIKIDGFAIDTENPKDACRLDAEEMRTDGKLPRKRPTPAGDAAKN